MAKTAKPKKEKTPLPKKSKGLGDSIAKVTQFFGIDKVVDSVADALEEDCGCDKRRQFLNELFPYGQDTGAEYKEVDGKQIRVL